MHEKIMNDGKNYSIQIESANFSVMIPINRSYFFHFKLINIQTSIQQIMSFVAKQCKKCLLTRSTKPKTPNVLTNTTRENQKKGEM